MTKQLHFIGKILKANTTTLVVVGISPNSEIQDPQFTVYPNPNKGIFIIKLSASNILNYRLTVYDVLGRETLSREIQNTQTTIDLRGQSHGIYQLVLSGSDFTVTKKIVIQ